MAKREMKNVENVENVENLQTTDATETVVEPKETVKIETKKGVVVGCTKLNVRKEAKKDAEVVTIIDAGTKMTVYLDESIKDFYPIRIAKGDINGFCMKKYIEVK